ncbi:hypothetical protein BGW36DRAFT_423160 [Talaromyces proteolyticus]|uniref:Zn(2)-C6 fungal-type domain-containing protein n=1 Tax=Talaromyces proteolyticus TaxID=1131652 RepID=A0AAD4L152_9EURO|nr:uncharacterized protein BGW36DRAFT_423160 [Talaromyces proteolyticus]KAH8703605.1 hypothetical protein BGW36DRAFT_423160 [Talaromyces proteolyticus]
MVGIRRSKACLTCIKRKKGVSDPVPSTGSMERFFFNCRKACIPCQGYSKPRVFINSFAQDGIRHEQDAASQKDCLHVDFSNKIARSAHETKILEQFWQSYFPNGEALPIDVAHSVLGGLMQNIQDLYGTEIVLRKVILALSLSTLARQDASLAWMKEEGRRLYGDAMQGAVVTLRVPQKRQENGLLAAVQLFSLFEAVYGDDGENDITQAKSWLTHCFGNVALIVQRGPLAFTTGSSHRLFVDGRLHLTITALKARKKSFLSEVAWKTIPWSVAKKYPKDLLVDILVDVPSMFEAIDVMMVCKEPTRKAQLCKRLRDHYLSLERSLVQWHTDFSPALINIDNETQITEVITPQMLATAHLSTLYWTTCIIIYGMVGRLLFQNDDYDVLKQRYIDPGIFCRNILKIVPVFFDPSTGIFRVHLVTFPMTVVMMHLATLPSEQMMQEKALLAKYLQNPACVTIRKFVASLEPQSFRDVPRLNTSLS